MGTYGIVRTLLRHWSTRQHPIYRADANRVTLLPVTQIAEHFVRKIWRPLAGAGLVIGGLVAADFLCGGATAKPTSLVAGLFSLCTVVSGSLLMVILLILMYLWPLAVAVSASGAIVVERERQTWDVLLTTPYDRDDLVLAKMASALRRFNPYGEMLLWTQMFLLALIFVLVVGQFSRNGSNTTAELLLQLPLLVLTMIEFAVARVQDYVLSGLLGTLSSLLTPTRQSSGVLALLLASVLVLVRTVLTVGVLLTMPPVSFTASLLLIATGPSSVVALALPIPAALAALLVMMLAREAVIRVLFGWITRHLSDVPAQAL